MAITIMGIAHGSGGRIGDGLALSPPAFPRSSDRERIVPLVGHLLLWEPLLSVSHWDLPEQTLLLLVFLGDDAGLRTVVFNRRLLKQS